LKETIWIHLKGRFLRWGGPATGSWGFLAKVPGISHRKIANVIFFVIET
jgi:hypothetical protein